MKVIIFSASKYSERDYNRFGGTYYESKGYDVIYVGLHKIFYGNHASLDSPLLFDKTYYEPDTLQDLHSILTLFNDTVLLSIAMLDFASPNLRIVGFLRICKISGIVPLFYHGGAIPNTLIDEKKFLLEKIFRKIIFFLYFKSFSFLCFVGYLSRLKVVLGARANELFLDGRYISYAKFYAHTLDYELDKFNISDNCKFSSTEKYAVFLDEFAPFHPDNEQIFGKSFTDYAGNYYANLGRLFDVVESQGYKVVIAAHPRSRYSEDGFGWCFGDRYIAYGCTAELVRQSAFCLAHFSTSINYCVLNDKPVLQMSTMLYRDIPEYIVAFDSVREELGLDYIDIDSNELIFVEPTINRAKYNRYMEMYIKAKNSPNMSIYEIFLEVAKNES